MFISKNNSTNFIVNLKVNVENVDMYLQRYKIMKL